MTSRTLVACMSVLLMALANTACSSDPSGPKHDPILTSSAHLESDLGGSGGLGETWDYTQENAVFTVIAVSRSLTIEVAGEQAWSSMFYLPEPLTRLEVGHYELGINWSHCFPTYGSFDIAYAAYDADALTDLDLTFEEACDTTGGPGMRGHILWTRDDPTLPPGPVRPPPAALWAPAAGTVPASGDFIYLESEAGDYIGQGLTYLYTPTDATIYVEVFDQDVAVQVYGSKSWYGTFSAMYPLDRPEVGYYGNVHLWPVHNPARGGLEWGGDGRGCTTAEGWFVVDSIEFVGGRLAAVDLRFEQVCNGGGVLHGRVRWTM